MSKFLLNARELTAGYGKRPVLRDINLMIAAGDFLGVLGPNGSGKTTLIRALTGRIKPFRGQVFWQGKPLKEIDLRILARMVAVVSQTPPGGLDLPVADIVTLGRIPHFRRFQWWPDRQDREIVNWAMGVTETGGMSAQNFHTLSGAEQQRVLIALALAQKPRLLFLDEPTLHLDINYQAGIFELLRRLNHDYGLTILTVLHDLNLASTYCQRLLFLKEGEIWKAGPPEELMTKDNVNEVFRVRMAEITHPVSGTPLLFPEPVLDEGRKTD